MAITRNEEIKQLEAQADTLQRRLWMLEQQIAGYGALAVPPHKVLEQEEMQRALDDLRDRLKQLREVPVAADAPYIGLLTFQEADADRFFGREALISDLVDKARATSFLAVLGPSGSGKSSVVRAGLIPALKRCALPGSDRWRYVTLKPGARPLDALATTLATLHGGDLASILALSSTLATDQRALVRAADILLAGQDGARLVLLVDQAEELWTLAPTEPEARTSFVEQQQRPFLHQLLSALPVSTSPLLIIFTMRADFLHRAAEHPALARAIGEHDLIVSPMTMDELRMAIERPAEAAGASFEHGLVDELIKQTVDRPGALPLLEYALLELWKTKRADGRLTWAAFQNLGGVEGALAARADAIVAERYPAAEQREQLRKLLLRLVQPGEGAADTRRRVRLDELVPADHDLADVHALLTPLADERLLTTGYDATSGAETVEVAHEALIRAWPTFGEWISANRVDLVFQLQLGEAAQDWIQSDESPDFLWSGLRLANADAWIARAQPALNARDQSFLEASHAAATARAEAEQADRRERETLLQARAAADRRNVSRLRIFLVLGSVLLLVALALLVYAINRQQKESEARAAAEQQTHIAESQARAAESLFDLTNGDPERSLLLARAALPTNTQSYEPLVFRALRRTLEDTVSRQRLIGHTAPVTGASWSDDEQRVLTWSDDHIARVWDVASGKAVQVLEGQTDPVTGPSWSKDETRVLTWSDDQTARIWDVASGKAVQVLEGHTDRVTGASWSKDEMRVLTWSDDHTARIWDVASGKAVQVLEGHTGPVYGARWSKDETRVLTWSNDHTVRIWVVEPRLLAAELTERVCHVFSDAEIGKMMPSWRGCAIELAAVDADLKAYNKFSLRR